MAVSEPWPIEKLCEIIFEGGRSRELCARALAAIVEQGYWVPATSTERYVASRLVSVGLLRRQALPVCGEADAKRVYVPNRSGLARLRLLLEQLDRAIPACVKV